MCKNKFSIAILATALFFTTGLIASAAATKPAIRLGWQTPWATQGQLVMGLKHSNIPTLSNINIDYIGFSYGAPLNQAALAGQVDVLLTADQPAVALMARNSGYKIVARMMYNRTCLYAPAKSPVGAIKDLSGTHVAGPVGAAAERIALQAMKDAGIDMSSIQFGTMDMAQQAALISSSGNEGEKWGDYTALYGFDPFPALLEVQGKAKMLDCGKVVSLVLASNEMLTTRRDELKSFLEAFKLSWLLYSRDGEKLDRFFLSESQSTTPEEALKIAASVEPNKTAKNLSEINMTLSNDDFKIIDTAVNYLASKKAIPEKLDPRLSNYVDLSIMKEVDQEAGLSSKAKKVRINN